MLFDLDFTPDGFGRGTPIFFSVRLENGILKVPPELYRKKGDDIVIHRLTEYADRLDYLPPTAYTKIAISWLIHLKKMVNC